MLPILTAERFLAFLEVWRSSQIPLFLYWYPLSFQLTLREKKQFTMNDQGPFKQQNVEYIIPIKSMPRFFFL